MAFGATGGGLPRTGAKTKDLEKNSSKHGASEFQGGCPTRFGPEAVCME